MGFALKTGILMIMPFLAFDQITVACVPLIVVFLLSFLYPLCFRVWHLASVRWPQGLDKIFLSFVLCL
jgi:hypothetical protein